MARQSEQLDEFILRARRAGRATPEIRELLERAGWKPEQVEPYLADDELVPPPPPAPGASGRDIFFSLLSFLTLGISAVSLGSVMFSLIDRFVATEVVPLYAYGRQTGLQWALASLIVAAPIYYAIAWKYARDLKVGVVAPSSGIRKVLTYLALFLASAVVIGDVTTLVFRFVSGEVTTSFLLKVAVILALGGWVIWYYWVGVKHDERRMREPGFTAPRSWRRGHASAFIVVVLACLISGFTMVGSPQEQQKLVRDERRISDLQGMTYALQNYYDRTKKLPEVLVEAYGGGYVVDLPGDPSTTQPYEYRKTGTTSYELCATFEFSTAEDEASRPKALYPAEPYEFNWSHPAGRYCFNRTVVTRTPD